MFSGGLRSVRFSFRPGSWWVIALVMLVLLSLTPTTSWSEDLQPWERDSLLLLSNLSWLVQNTSETVETGNEIETLLNEIVENRQRSLDDYKASLEARDASLTRREKLHEESLENFEGVKQSVEEGRLRAEKKIRRNRNALIIVATVALVEALVIVSR